MHKQKGRCHKTVTNLQYCCNASLRHIEKTGIHCGKRASVRLPATHLLPASVRNRSRPAGGNHALAGPGRPMGYEGRLQPLGSAWPVACGPSGVSNRTHGECARLIQGRHGPSLPGRTDCPARPGCWKEGTDQAIGTGRAGRLNGAAGFPRHATGPAVAWRRSKGSERSRRPWSISRRCATK